jgi:uncharacterized membrane protein YbhN (UPF0104 family)
LSIVTVFLVAYIIYQNWPDITEAVSHLPEANCFILLLLIPEQLFMYYACGRIFFSYLKKSSKVKKLSIKESSRISLELNFVNHAVPAGGFGGLAFLSWRLRPYNVTAGQSSFLYVFRYAITTVFNYVQALVAILVLFFLNLIPDNAHWVIWVSLIMNVGVAIALGLIIYIASGKKRINFFSKIATNFANWLVRTFTFGQKRTIITYEKINHYLMDIHESVLIARRDKKNLRRPVFWGIIYSFCEIATYWIVAISLGRPELLPYIMVGEAIGSVFDGIVPYGLYELGMTGVMVALGIDFGTATIVTIMTRVATLLFTIATGYWPYNKTIMQAGKDDGADA